VSSPWYIQSCVACTRQGMVCTAVLQVPHRKVMHWDLPHEYCKGGVFWITGVPHRVGTGYQVPG
jgi:hypothetical protein